MALAPLVTAGISILPELYRTVFPKDLDDTNLNTLSPYQHNTGQIQSFIDACRRQLDITKPISLSICSTSNFVDFTGNNFFGKAGVLLNFKQSVADHDYLKKCIAKAVIRISHNDTIIEPMIRVALGSVATLFATMFLPNITAILPIFIGVVTSYLIHRLYYYLTDFFVDYQAQSLVFRLAHVRT